ncbi:histidinol-phosphate transaminase [Prolixibacter sp. SD074]|jgi:histidinol-phosphate aminotransferase|uniref:histidinol-phosphate transaminase n=1 Tax=Prolixibacter sp. SD074 TaxID=2652391 RepID=UPI001282A46A|nr:histidinol-phosphate transaminase [Prolixibacter sp. SD074]GET31045.1 histidinol-phosphate aminotransferase [Prolixibacter sp. SD074]
MTFDIQKLLRDNIRKLKPYSSARDEFSGEAAVFLDANENPFNAPYNRYPDPRQKELKSKIAPVKNIPAENIFLGNGSDEPIDLLIRAFCSPEVDSIVAIAPTYGMYRVAADVNDVKVIEAPLNADYTLSVKTVLNTVTPYTKMVFLCSPNNPTGNALKREAMLEIMNNFEGLVVVDEAYIDFCPEKSLLPLLAEHPNLVVLQTFSKAWGMAGIRLGMAFAGQDIIDVLNRIKYPYNINILTQLKAMELIGLEKEKSDWVKVLVSEREKLAEKLQEFPFVVKVFPSDANFLLVKTLDPRGIYNYLVDEKIIVRDRSGVALCEGSLRISVGSEMENQRLIEALETLV